MSELQIVCVVVGGVVLFLAAFFFGHRTGSQETKSYEALEEKAVSWRDEADKLRTKVRALKKKLRRIAKDM